jgi:hypothetical protein
MNRPVWLLDIDGVVNAMSKHPPIQIWPEKDWVEVTVSDNTDTKYRMLAAQPVLDFISEVHRRRKAEIRWHSTWQGDSEKVGAALNLPHFWLQDAVAEFENQTDFLLRGKWWKLPAAWRVVGKEQRPLLWTDDDIVDLTKKETDALTVAGRTLLVAPTSTYGLSKRQLGRIAEFLGME